MGWQNALSGLGKGALWGGIGGAVLGTLTMGPFGTIAGAIGGAKLGGAVGGIMGAFKPDYQQIQQVYNPNMAYGGAPMQSYGGYQMPNQLFGNSPVVTTTVPTSGGDGWKMAGAALAGAAATSMMMPGYGYGYGSFGMPFYGMGYGSTLGLGPFNWNVW
ncbi:MAG: hypothetical protein HYV07_15380 [Deltaproteobacteria bacterium]|nr:hypothetical protein [Deltaproteobacteria bacterium]